MYLICFGPLIIFLSTFHIVFFVIERRSGNLSSDQFASLCSDPKKFWHHFTTTFILSKFVGFYLGCPHINLWKWVDIKFLKVSGIWDFSRSFIICVFLFLREFDFPHFMFYSHILRGALFRTVCPFGFRKDDSIDPEIQLCRSLVVLNFL